MAFDKTRTVTFVWPILGADEAQLPITIGGVRFGLLTADHIRTIARSGLPKTAATLKARYESYFAPFKNKVCASVRIRTKDPDVTKPLARNKIREVMEVINFFASAARFHSGLYIPGDIGSDALSPNVEMRPLRNV